MVERGIRSNRSWADGDVVLDPPDHARMRDWLGFAGIAAPDVPMIQRELQCS